MENIYCYSTNENVSKEQCDERHSKLKSLICERCSFYTRLHNIFMDMTKTTLSQIKIKKEFSHLSFQVGECNGKNTNSPINVNPDFNTDELAEIINTATANLLGDIFTTLKDGGIYISGTKMSIDSTLFPKMPGFITIFYTIVSRKNTQFAEYSDFIGEHVSILLSEGRTINNVQITAVSPSFIRAENETDIQWIRRNRIITIFKRKEKQNAEIHTETVH